MNNFVSSFCRIFHYVQITGGLVGWNTNKHMSTKCLFSMQYAVMDVHRLSRPNRCHIMVANVNYMFRDQWEKSTLKDVVESRCSWNSKTLQGSNENLDKVLGKYLWTRSLLVKPQMSSLQFMYFWRKLGASLI